jgi:hypothetical protein
MFCKPYVFLANGVMFWEYVDKSDTYFPKTKTSAVVMSGGLGASMMLHYKLSCSVEAGYGQFKPLRDEPQAALFYSVGASYHIKIRRFKNQSELQPYETESDHEEDYREEEK